MRSLASVRSVLLEPCAGLRENCLGRRMDRNRWGHLALAGIDALNHKRLLCDGLHLRVFHRWVFHPWVFKEALKKEALKKGSVQNGSVQGKGSKCVHEPHPEAGDTRTTSSCRFVAWLWHVRTKRPRFLAGPQARLRIRMLRSREAFCASPTGLLREADE